LKELVSAAGDNIHTITGYYHRMISRTIESNFYKIPGSKYTIEIDRNLYYNC